MGTNYYEFLREANKKILKDLETYTETYKKTYDDFFTLYTTAMAEMEKSSEEFMKSLNEIPPTGSDNPAEGIETKK